MKYLMITFLLAGCVMIDGEHNAAEIGCNIDDINGVKSEKLRDAGTALSRNKRN